MSIAGHVSQQMLHQITSLWLNPSKTLVLISHKPAEIQFTLLSVFTM